jgi:hypothetical protein
MPLSFIEIRTTFFGHIESLAIFDDHALLGVVDKALARIGEFPLIVFI